MLQQVSVYVTASVSIMLQQVSVYVTTGVSIPYRICQYLLEQA